MPQPLWHPAAPADTNIARFVAARRAAGISVDNSAELAVWAIDQPAPFWRAVWDDCDVIGNPGSVTINPSDELTAVEFFPDATLNFAENLLRRDDDSPALIYRDEAGTAIDYSWRELHALVSRIAQALRAQGIQPGDRIAAWMSNRPETYALMLATASIGAVFSSTSPDFGAAGVLDRFRQIQPRILVAVDGYAYAGRTHDCRPRLAEIAAGLDSLERVIVVPGLPPSTTDAAAGTIENGPLGSGIALNSGIALDAWLAPFEPQPMQYTPLPFDHPLYILFSSGTTGAPKCIVHRAGGILLKHLTEHRLHCDVRPDDRVFFFTTAGWMMWNWLASALASEATLVLYDGSPFHRDGAVLFDLIDEVGVTLFGTSASFLDAVAKADLRPVDSHRLDSVRTICSTGSPLAPASFAFVYEAIKPDVHLASISGGTDLCGCLVAGDPTQPVLPGEIQTACFGVDAQVVDADGRPVAAGQQGELVCANAFPSMPLGFWDDASGERYRAAYFERFPGWWHQGDFAERTDSGGFVIHGRSDATLNPGGVRIGTAEIYAQAEQVDAVVESLAIGQEWNGSTRLVLFVVLRHGRALDDELRGQIAAQIRSGATPRHVPAVIASVPALPRTRSGKLVELAVRDIVHGRAPANREALANPEALDYFRDHPDCGR